MLVFVYIFWLSWDIYFYPASLPFYFSVLFPVAVFVLFVDGLSVLCHLCSFTFVSLSYCHLLICSATLLSSSLFFSCRIVLMRFFFFRLFFSISCLPCLLYYLSLQLSSFTGFELLPPGRLHLAHLFWCLIWLWSFLFIIFPLVLLSYCHGCTVL